MLKIKDKEVNLRITKKQIKNAKERFSVDLQVMDVNNMQDSKVMQVMQDPIFLIDCFWAFHEEQLLSLGFTRDSFDDAVDETNIEAIRDGFVNSCAAFFPFLRMLCMTFAASLAGPPSTLPEVKPPEV